VYQATKPSSNALASFSRATAGRTANIAAHGDRFWQAEVPPARVIERALDQPPRTRRVEQRTGNLRQKWACCRYQSLVLYLSSAT
jgi:hypothetical protein